MARRGCSCLRRPSLCVEGSQGFSTTNNPSPKAPPKPAAQKPVLSLSNTSAQQTKWDDDASDSLQNGRGRPKGSSTIFECPANRICPDFGYECRRVSITCAYEGTQTRYACLPYCQKGQQCVGTCALSSIAESKRTVYKAADGSPKYQEKISTGLCYPKQGTRALGCKYDPRCSVLENLHRPSKWIILRETNSSPYAFENLIFVANELLAYKPERRALYPKLHAKAFPNSTKPAFAGGVRTLYEQDCKISLNNCCRHLDLSFLNPGWVYGTFIPPMLLCCVAG